MFARTLGKKMLWVVKLEELNLEVLVAILVEVLWEWRAPMLQKAELRNEGDMMASLEPLDPAQFLKPAQTLFIE